MTPDLSRIEELLERANGRRRKYTLGLSHVVLMRRAFGTDPEREFNAWIWCGPDHRLMMLAQPADKATVAMAARVDGDVYLGVGTCPASIARPANTWDEAQSLSLGRPRRTMTALRRWSRRPDVICVSVEYDWILEEGEFA